MELIDLHRELIRIHKDNPAIRNGSFTFLDSEDDLLCYARFNREQQFIIIVNNSNEEKTKKLSVLGAGVPLKCTLRQLIVTTDLGYSLMPQYYQVEEGAVSVTIQKKSAVILTTVQHELNRC